MHRIIMLIVDVKNGMKGHVFKMAAVFVRTNPVLFKNWLVHFMWKDHFCFVWDIHLKYAHF